MQLILLVLGLGALFSIFWYSILLGAHYFKGAPQNNPNHK